MATAGATEWYKEALSELESAKILKDRGKVKDAYFLCGQAVEFLLKAIYLKRNNLSEMPPDHKGARWHDLSACAEAARLGADLNQKSTSLALRANWLTVRDWKSNARFPGERVPARELNDLFVAVCNPADGVWQWLITLYGKN